MTGEIKTNKKTIWIVSIIILIIIGFFILSDKNDVSNSETMLTDEIGSEKGDIAHDFSLTTIEGNVVKLSDFKGKYVLFASMATWCTPCQIEAQNVKRAQDNFEHIPLLVMQIDVDPRETNQDLINFRKTFGKEDWIMGFDNGSITQLYNIKTFDTTLVINPEGKIIYRDNGFPIDTKTLEDLIIKGESSDLVLDSTHEHADISIVFGNEKVDFSQDKYQLRSSFVHFEEGNGEKIHVHAKGVTLRYVFETLGWEIENDCITAYSEKYCDGKIIVNGEESDLEHELKDDEKIEVEYK